MSSKQVRVGMGVLIKKNGKYLLLKRKAAHDKGTWHPPGGHLEFGESFEECAKRESFEEAGVEIENVQFLYTTNDVFVKDDKHYVSIYVTADWKSGEPTIKEPDKCAEIGWFEKEKFPEPLFLSMKNLLKSRIKL